MQLRRQTSQEARCSDLLWGTCRINFLNFTPSFLHSETRFAKDASLISDLQDISYMTSGDGGGVGVLD